MTGLQPDSDKLSSWNEFVEIINVTMEKRKRRSRSYPRVLKYSGKMYPRHSTIYPTGGLTERHYITV